MLELGGARLLRAALCRFVLQVWRWRVQMRALCTVTTFDLKITYGILPTTYAAEKALLCTK
jgi:hypothetical protein